MLGTEQVFFAVVATTATLAAVFLPLSFLPGQTGALFREFGVTLALSVAISAFVALSLCPMMASRMLRAATTSRRTRGAPTASATSRPRLSPAAPRRARRRRWVVVTLGARLRRHRLADVRERRRAS